MIDQSVYPDQDDPPTEFTSLADQADYVHRICGAWDYGIPPHPETTAMFMQWREIFDRYPVSMSPAYHAFRSLFGWPRVPGFCLEADYERFDAREGRSDPCAHLM